MKLKVCILAVLAVLVVNAEDRQPAKSAPKAKKSAPAATATPPAPLTLPAGATQIEPGTYAYTDPKGKKWIYRQTPFGLARLEDKPAAEPTPAQKGPTITATESGDVIKFERAGPFGPYRWEKKKSDLAEDERAAWERSKQSATSKAKE